MEGWCRVLTSLGREAGRIKRGIENWWRDLPSSIRRLMILSSAVLIFAGVVAGERSTEINRITQAIPPGSELPYPGFVYEPPGLRRSSLAYLKAEGETVISEKEAQESLERLAKEWLGVQARLVPPQRFLCVKPEPMGDVVTWKEPESESGELEIGVKTFDTRRVRGDEDEEKIVARVDYDFKGKKYNFDIVRYDPDAFLARLQEMYGEVNPLYLDMWEQVVPRDYEQLFKVIKERREVEIPKWMRETLIRTDPLHHVKIAPGDPIPWGKMGDLPIIGTEYISNLSDARLLNLGEGGVLVGIDEKGQPIVIAFDRDDVAGVGEWAEQMAGKGRRGEGGEIIVLDKREEGGGAMLLAFPKADRRGNYWGWDEKGDVAAMWRAIEEQLEDLGISPGREWLFVTRGLVPGRQEINFNSAP